MNDERAKHSCIWLVSGLEGNLYKPKTLIYHRHEVHFRNKVLECRLPYTSL